MEYINIDANTVIKDIIIKHMKSMKNIVQWINKQIIIIRTIYLNFNVNFAINYIKTKQLITMK